MVIVPTGCAGGALIIIVQACRRLKAGGVLMMHIIVWRLMLSDMKRLLRGSPQ